MVMRPDILDIAVDNAKSMQPGSKLVYFTPRGKLFSQKVAHDLVKENLILICGRFEGVDERFLAKHQPMEISIGDFVLSGGEIAAITVLDACVRLLPGVMGDNGSLSEESFAIDGDFAGLLEYPHYTKPPVWDGRAVPEVLLSGNHANINKWRMSEAQNLTKASRPDLWALRQEIKGKKE